MAHRHQSRDKQTFPLVHVCSSRHQHCVANRPQLGGLKHLPLLSQESRVVGWALLCSMRSPSRPAGPGAASPPAGGLLPWGPLLHVASGLSRGSCASSEDLWLLRLMVQRQEARLPVPSCPKLSSILPATFCCHKADPDPRAGRRETLSSAIARPEGSRPASVWHVRFCVSRMFQVSPNAGFAHFLAGVLLSCLLLFLLLWKGFSLPLYLLIIFVYEGYCFLHVNLYPASLLNFFFFWVSLVISYLDFPSIIPSCV